MPEEMEFREAIKICQTRFKDPVTNQALRFLSLVFKKEVDAYIRRLALSDRAEFDQLSEDSRKGVIAEAIFEAIQSVDTSRSDGEIHAYSRRPLHRALENRIILNPLRIKYKRYWPRWEAYKAAKGIYPGAVMRQSLHEIRKDLIENYQFTKPAAHAVISELIARSRKIDPDDVPCREAENAANFFQLLEENPEFLGAIKELIDFLLYSHETKRHDPLARILTAFHIVMYPDLTGNNQSEGKGTWIGVCLANARLYAKGIPAGSRQTDYPQNYLSLIDHLYEKLMGNFHPATVSNFLDREDWLGNKRGNLRTYISRLKEFTCRMIMHADWEELCKERMQKLMLCPEQVGIKKVKGNRNE